MALKRRTRNRIYRVSVYAIVIALLVWLVVATDWSVFANQFLNAEVAASMWPGIITIALKNTILFTITAFAGGLLLGIVMALLKLSSIGPFRWFATAWIELFRGLPALLTIFAFVYMVPIAFNGVQFPGGPIGGGLIALIVVASAYMAEVIRAGIQAVPKGQTEASRSLGMSPLKTTFWIVLPQGIRVVIPPLTNEFVLLLKDTSLLFIAGSTLFTKELTTFSRDVMNQSANATPLVMAALLYLVVTIPLTRFVAWLERRMAKQR